VIVAPALGGWELHTVMGLTMLLGASLAWSVSIIQLRANRACAARREMIPGNAPWQPCR
jgi:hypothetical protein